MNPSAGVKAWPKPARSSSGRFIRVAIAGAAALLLGTYLAGVFFLWSMHADPRRATPLTLSQYGYYYGDGRMFGADSGDPPPWRSRSSW